MSTATVTGRVQGKIAVVTGAADGIGRALAHMLAKHGAAVAILDRQHDAAEAVAGEIQAIGAEAMDAYLKSMSALHPIGHVGDPDDIAYGVLYLASDESRFVTGTELVIDGGYTAQ